MTPDSHTFACLDTTARLAVWTVRAFDPVTELPHGFPFRHAAYMAEEAVQCAAAMSGIDRKDWNDYVWTATMKGTEP